MPRPDFLLWLEAHYGDPLTRVRVQFGSGTSASDASDKLPIGPLEDPVPFLKPGTDSSHYTSDDIIGAVISHQGAGFYTIEVLTKHVDLVHLIFGDSMRYLSTD